MYQGFEATPTPEGDYILDGVKLWATNGTVATILVVMAQVPNALMVNPHNIKASNVPELIAFLKGNSDRTICATQGNGTTSHLTSELFQLLAKVKLRHIPYRGSAPALQGLVAGDVDIMFDNLGVSLALAQAGKLKLLAVASSARLPSLPIRYTLRPAASVVTVSPSRTAIGRMLAAINRRPLGSMLKVRRWIVCASLC